MMQQPAIFGIGTARPAHAIGQAEALRFAVECASASGANGRPAKLLPEIFRRTHVRQRGSVLIQPSDSSNGGSAITAADLEWFYPRPSQQRAPTTAERMEQFGRLAPPLAMEACRNALTDAGVAPDEVTHLVTVTCTGFVSPGVEHALVEHLGLPRTVQRAQIGFMGCHAALNGINVAAAFAAAHPGAVTLMCSVELCSLHFQYGFEPDRIVANALFADGSAALVIGADRGGRAEPLRVRGSGTCLLEGCAGDMSWRVGDEGFHMSLSARVPGLISQQLRPWIDAFLQRHGLGVADVGSWAIHAGGPRIVSSVAERLGLAEGATEASRGVLRDCGNMSSATILFILRQLRDSGAERPCVMLAFGPGLTAEAVLLA